MFPNLLGLYHLFLKKVPTPISLAMSQIQPIADAQAFADIQVEQELQDTIDEAYIPELPEEEEVQRAIPGTFELTPGASAELNLQNVSSYIENGMYKDV